MSNAAAADPIASPSAPWWRFPMVWLVLAGPVLVILAGSATMVVAYRHADVALVETPTVTSLRADRRAAAPALVARNHAATPTRP